MAQALANSMDLGGRLASVHAAPSVQRALQAIRTHDVSADQIDYAILAAINVTLCLSSGGSDRVAEGFNRDLALSGGRVPSAEPL